MMKMFSDEMKREQGRKIELNLQDIIRSFRHNITSKNPILQERFFQNRQKELKDILGSDYHLFTEKKVDYGLTEEDIDDQDVKETFTEADMLRMVEFPEIPDNDPFFQQLWKERSASLNEKYLFQEKLHQFAIRKPYNDFNEHMFTKFKEEQIEKVLKRQTFEIGRT